MQFVRLADAQRLASCVLQHKGDPIYIEYVDEPTPGVYMAHGFRIGDHAPIHIDLSKEEMHPPKFLMGYVNVWRNKQLNVVQTLRSPARRTYLGLCSGNSTFQELEPGHERPHLTWQNVYLGTGFINLQKGDYPSLKQVLEYGRGAISADFALVRVTLHAYRIYWEGNVIGEYNSKENAIELYEPYSWCLETLQRLMKIKQENTSVAISA